MGRLCLPYGDPASLSTRLLRQELFQQLSLLPPRVFPAPRERLIPEGSRSVFRRTRLFHSRVPIDSYRPRLRSLLMETVTSLPQDSSWVRLPADPPRV